MHHEPSFFADPRTWVAVAFTIFVALFGPRLWRVMAGLLDKRAETVRAELAEAARLRQEAEAMLADARTRRETALADAQSLLANARAEAASLAARATEEARAAAERREKMAVERIAAAEKAAVAEVRAAAVDIAIAAAREVIAEVIDAQADATLIDATIARLPQALRAA